MVGGINRQVKVTAIDPHMATWYGPEVILSFKLKIFFLKFYIFSEFTYCSERVPC